MAASLLDGIDFDNLPSEVPAVAIKKLAIATQERFNIAIVRTNGTKSSFFNTIFKYFPYGANTNPEYVLNEGDPIPDLTSEIETLLGFCANLYADVEKWDDAATNLETGSTSYRLSDTADDSGTYDNRLFEITGYTSYPDLSVYAKEEVKKWYDMLTELKYIHRSSGFNLGTGSYHIFKGEFDVGTNPFYSTDDPLGIDANFYGIDETDPNLEDPSNTTPYTDMVTANTNYQTSTAAIHNEDIDGSFTYDTSPYSVRFRRDGSGDYISCLRAFTDTHVLNWANIRSTVGMTGKPVSYKRQARVTISETFPTGEDTNMSYPYSTTGDNQRFYCDLSITEVSDTTEIEIDLDINPATMPANLTDIGANELVQVSTTVSYPGNWLENWDGEGGFDYYTPSP
jgi:hypothetical protein